MAEPTTSHELVRDVAAEFDRRGWLDEDDLALKITIQAEQGGRLDPDAAAALADGAFLTANRIDHNTLRAALKAVFADRALVNRPTPTFVDQSISIGDNNTITGSINAGGNQLIVANNAPSDQILEAFTAFTASALAHGFAPEELELLDRIAEARDINSDDLQAAAREGIENANPEPGRIAKFRDTVLASTASGLAVQAILAAAAALI
jgi:hypothetical protein